MNIKNLFEDNNVYGINNKNFRLSRSKSFLKGRLLWPRLMRFLNS